MKSLRGVKMKFFRSLFLGFLLSALAIIFYSSTPNKAKYEIQNQLHNNALNIEKQIVKNKKPIIVIDPGHGGHEQGAPENRIKEKDLNLAIALKLRNMLKEENKIQVVMTREDDKSVELHDRVKMANDLNADLFLSIHNNWFPDKDIRGSMTLYYTYYKNTPGSSFDSRRFAVIMNEVMVKELKTNNLGIIPRDDLVVIKYTSMPAVLVEITCLSNKHDRAMLQSKDFIEKAAKSLYTGLVRALEELDDP